MALNIFNGIMAAIDDSTFSQMLTDLGVLPDGHGIASGLAVSPGTGRAVNVGAGRSLQAGTSGVLSATTSVPIAANTSTSPRNDLVCVQCDWAAARAAYLNATGDVLAKSAAARLAAGSLIAVQGTASSTPADPALTRTPGTLWQEPLKRVRVAAGATSFTTANLTDITPATATSATVTFPGAFTATTDGSPLTVSRAGALVTFSGHVSRGTTNLGSSTAGDSTDFGGVAIIPSGFRPDRVIDLPVRSGGTGTSTAMPTNWLAVNPDGTALLTVGIGNTITAGSLIRIGCTTWKAA